MYGVVREFQPPLGVTHAVRGRFGTSSSLATVFARKNSIDLYVVRANNETARLELLSSKFLGSTIVSLAAVRRPSSTSDLLFVGFERMRVTVFSWQPDIFSWVTEQLLDLGKLVGTNACPLDSTTMALDSKCKWRPLLRGNRGSDSNPVIRSDPSGHCVAILSKTHDILYILPIRSDDDSANDGGRIVNLSSVFVVDLRPEHDAANVKDFIFLHDMFEPHISLLYETKRTWSGRTAVQRNTCFLLTLSIDLRSKRSSSSWTMDQLPYDSDKLEAVPDSARGGVLVISSSVIMQVRHGNCVAGLSLNCYGDEYAKELNSKYETIVPSDTLVECDAAHCRFLDVETKDSTQSIALLSLKGGELYFLHVAIDSKNAITMKRSGSTVIASEIVPINERFFILSSRLSDSLLIEYQRVNDEVSAELPETPGASSNGTKANGNANGNGSTKAKSSKGKKRKRTAQEDEEYEMIYCVKPPPRANDDSDDESDEQELTLKLNEDNDQGTRGVYDDEDELGFVFKSESTSNDRQGGTSWALTVKDTISCFGPGADIALGPSPKDASRTQLDIVVAGGYAKNGCLAVVHQFIRPSIFSQFKFPNCQGVWTLVDPTVLRKQRKERAKRNEEIMKRNEAYRVQNANAKESRRLLLQEKIAQLKREKTQHILAYPDLLKQENPLQENGMDPSGMANSLEDAATNTVKQNVHSKETPDKLDSDAIVPEVNTDSVGDVRSDVQMKDQKSEDLSAVPGMERDTTGNGPSIQGNEASVLENSGSGSNADSTSIKVSETEGRDGTVENSSYEQRDGNSAAQGVQGEQVISSGHNMNAPQAEHRDQGVSKSPEHGNKLSSSKKPRMSDSQQGAIASNEAAVDYNVELSKDEILKLRHDVESSIPLQEEEAIESPMDGEEGFHSIMLLSTKTSTIVLTMDSILIEVLPENTDFVTGERTITTQNILSNHAVVQIVPSRVRVVLNGKMQCEYLVEDGNSKIDQAQVCGSLVLLQTEEKRLIVLKVEAEPFIVIDEDEKDAQAFKEDEFDEYGMSVSESTSDDPTKNSEEETTSSKLNENKSYKNFSIKVDTKASELLSNVPIASAYLYTGPLASDIAEDGILNCSEESKNIIADGDASSPTPVDTALIDSEVPNSDAPELAEQKADPMLDDEDRIMYDDDGDKLLYGAMEDEMNANVTSETTKKKIGSSGDKGDSNVGSEAKMEKKPLVPEKGVASLDSVSTVENEGHLLVVITKDGCLRILSKELNYATVFNCPYFYTAPNLASDIRPSDSEKEAEQKFPGAILDYQIDKIFMTEVTASYHLPGFSTPFLMFTSRLGLPVLYRAFMRPKSQTRSSARSRLCFRRVTFRDGTTRWITRMMKKLAKNPSAQDSSGINNPNVSGGIQPIRFENVCGRSGIFLAGECPAFLFAERGYPRIHELTYSNRECEEAVSMETFERGQGVLSFAQFHNINCHRGFVYVGDDNIIRIGALPEKGDVNYDAPTPFCKIALRCTPHKVAYHGGSATYGVLASMPTLTTREERLARILQSLEKHDKRHYQHTAAQAEAETGDERAVRVPPLFEELHELRVYRPDNWSLIRSHKLDKGEVGLAITNMQINVFKQRTAGPGVEIPSSMKGDDGNETMFAASIKMRPKDVLVVGTGYLNGEDASSRGRLLMFEISRQDVVTEAGGAYTAFQLQLIAEKEVLSPVTAVASMEGYVIAGVGPLVSVYKLVGDEIVHLSFAFGQLYCSSIASLKQYVVAADMCKSISFMYFRERNNSVNFLAQDYDKVTCYATEFVLEKDKVSIAVSDGEGNVRLFNYAHASVAASRGGKRLLMNGGIHIGSRINKFVRVRIPDKQQDISSGESKRSAGNQALMFVTLDGAIGALIGVTEDQFKCLQKVGNVVTEYDGVVHCAGINMAEGNELRYKANATELLDQRVLDTRTVFDIMDLTIVEMNSLIRSCDLKPAQLANCLLSLDSLLWRF